MKYKFIAKKMIERVKKEGREYLLDEETLKFINLLDGKIGTDYNWENITKGEPLVWIEKDKDQSGTYVNINDCEPA